MRPLQWFLAPASLTAVVVNPFLPREGAAQAIAPEQVEEVVHLKDGIIVRRAIAEQRPVEGILVIREPERPCPAHGERARRKGPLAAGLLSALFPGVGPAYNGEWGEAAGFLGGSIVIGIASEAGRQAAVAPYL